MNHNPPQLAGHQRPVYSPRMLGGATGIPVENMSGEVIPPYACMIGWGISTDRSKIRVWKPGQNHYTSINVVGSCITLFNGPTEIPIDGSGSAQDGSYKITARYQYDSHFPKLRRYWNVGPIPGTWAVGVVVPWQASSASQPAQETNFMMLGTSDTTGQNAIIMRTDRTPFSVAKWASAIAVYGITPGGSGKGDGITDELVYTTGPDFSDHFRIVSDPGSLVNRKGYKRPDYDFTTYSVTIHCTYSLIYNRTSGSADFPVSSIQLGWSHGQSIWYGSICSFNNTNLSAPGDTASVKQYANNSMTLEWSPWSNHLSLGSLPPQPLYIAHKYIESSSAANSSTVINFERMSISITGVLCAGTRRTDAGLAPGDGPGTGFKQPPTPGGNPSGGIGEPE